MKKIGILLLLILSFSVNAEEVNVDKLYIQAQETLKNSYYFQKNESIDAYAQNKDNVFYGKTSDNKTIVVIVFPAKNKEASAWVYFEYSNNKLSPIAYGVSSESASDIEQMLSKEVADWLYDEM